MDKISFWVSRAFAIVLILFMMLFSVDCFEGSAGISKQLTCFFIHNIPAFILIIILLVAWKYELAGGILFILAAIAYSIYFRAFSGNSGVLTLLIPISLVGLLFIVQDPRLRKKRTNP